MIIYHALFTPIDENNTPANYVQRRKILKILILPMPWNGMVTRT
jgi:hypothetical protein